MMPTHPHHRAGWSFIELVVVLCILMALFAMVIAVWSMVRSRTAINSTRALVGAVTTQIVTYSSRTWTWQDPVTGSKSGQTFDLNHDGLIDGTPGVIAAPDLDGGFAPEIIASGYRGFVAMTGSPTQQASVAKNGQPLDAWKRPLRIAFAAKVYGTGGFGVWSAGPDGVDGTSDDLQSW